MKNLLMILILLTSCSNGRSLIKNRKNPLVLNEAYVQNITGGIANVDGSHSSNNYIFAFKEVNDIEIKAVWIDKVAYKFESFHNENQFFVSVSVSPNNTANIVDMKRPFSSKAKAIIMYRKNNQTHYLEVDEVEVKASVQAQ